MSKQELLAYLRRQIAAHGSQQRAAQYWGISAVYLSDVLKGRREPAGKFLAALRLRRVITYVPDTTEKGPTS